MISRRFSCRFVDQVLELLDLGLELGDLVVMAFLAEIELLFESSVATGS